jgi:hypothetical protein
MVAIPFDTLQQDDERGGDGSTGEAKISAFSQAIKNVIYFRE